MLFRSCEASIYLRPEAQGRGIGRRLYGALEAIMAYQGHRICYAIITSENTGSLAFHEKMGYSVTAKMPGCGRKFGRWLGVTWMEKNLGGAEDPRDFPRAWEDICQGAQKFLDILDILSIS